MANGKTDTQETEVQNTETNNDGTTNKVIQWEDDNFKLLQNAAKELGTDYHVVANMLIDVYLTLDIEDKVSLIQAAATRRIENLRNNS